MTARSAAELASALQPHGLVARGFFAFAAEADRPFGRSGKPAGSAALVGHAGAAYWPKFRDWLAAQPAYCENPLDTWSRKVISAVAERFSAHAVFPSDKPWLPFQQWAVRAEGLRPSPIGILIHPQYGLWHAYRGALLFEEEIELPEPPRPEHPCDTCVAKPCLNACPVGAFSIEDYDSKACIAHVTGADGAPCREAGCIARNACPIGGDYRYPEEVQAFHMSAFLANNPVN